LALKRLLTISADADNAQQLKENNKDGNQEQKEKKKELRHHLFPKIGTGPSADAPMPCISEEKA